MEEGSGEGLRWVQAKGSRLKVSFFPPFILPFPSYLPSLLPSFLFSLCLSVSVSLSLSQTTGTETKGRGEAQLTPASIHLRLRPCPS